MKPTDKPLDLVAIGAANMDIIAKIDKFPEIDDQVAVKGLTYAPGGSAANTVVAAAKLGLKVGFMGKVGRDHNGIELIKAFQDVGVDTDGIIVDADATVRPGIHPGRPARGSHDIRLPRARRKR